MADGTAGREASLKNRVSPEEWRIRTDLAALYRLVALYGWDDLIFTHISARVPGPDHHFLINPYGLFFEEMTASCLIKVDLEGMLIDETDQAINPAGFTIHSAVHAAREDAQFVMHLHTDAGIAVSAQADGLLPLSQHALLIRPVLAYHDYEGVALDLDERERLVADLGDKRVMILRNHGTLSVGATAGECWLGMYYLERACAQQIMALAGGPGSLLAAPPAAEAVVAGQARGVHGIAARLAWPGSLRLLDRKSPGYDS